MKVGAGLRPALVVYTNAGGSQTRPYIVSTPTMLVGATHCVALGYKLEKKGEAMPRPYQQEKLL